tara:strand:- start:125 stop:340 length:216 start_codon:yes stop_codon:yes gene_type:complete
MTDALTTEEIAQHYTAMGHSVDLINSDKPEDITDEEWTATIERNKEHLRVMVAKDYWTNEDMTAVNAAIGS